MSIVHDASFWRAFWRFDGSPNNPWKEVKGVVATDWHQSPCYFWSTLTLKLSFVVEEEKEEEERELEASLIPLHRLPNHWRNRWYIRCQLDEDSTCGTTPKVCSYCSVRLLHFLLLVLALHLSWSGGFSIWPTMWGGMSGTKSWSLLCSWMNEVLGVLFGPSTKFTIPSSLFVLIL